MMEVRPIKLFCVKCQYIFYANDVQDKYYCPRCSNEVKKE